MVWAPVSLDPSKVVIVAGSCQPHIDIGPSASGSGYYHAVVVGSNGDTIFDCANPRDPKPLPRVTHSLFILKPLRKYRRKR